MVDCCVYSEKELEKTKDTAKLAISDLTVFDHDYRIVHNKLVVGGADRILVRRLDEAVVDPKQRAAIDPLCKLLLMLYRCSDDRLQDSLAFVGGELFPTLLAIVFLGDQENTCPASVYELMHRLNKIRLNLQDVTWSWNLLTLFREVIDTIDSYTNPESVSFIMDWFVKGPLLQCERNRLFLMDFPGLFNSIVMKVLLFFKPGDPVNAKIAIFLRMLAESTINRAKMIRTKNFFPVLILLLQDESKETRGEILGTLKLLALESSGRSRVFACFDGIFVEVSINSLGVPGLKMPALEFLIILLAFFETGKLLLKQHPDLLSYVCRAASPNEQSFLLFAQTVSRLASFLKVSSDKGGLLGVIVQLCTSKDPRVRLEGAIALLEQTQSPASSFFIVRVPEAVDMINKISVDKDSKVRDAAAEIVSALSSTSLNERALAHNRKMSGMLTTNVVSVGAE